MTPEEFEEKLEELWIRFNTSPKLYLKEDYLILYQIIEELANLHDTRIVELKNNWDEVVASNTLPDGILIKDTIRGIQEKLASIIISLEGVAKEETSLEILTAIENIDIDLTPVEEKIDEVDEKVDGVSEQIGELNSAKQDVLDAIDEIDIDTSDLAKEATLGTPAAGQPSTIFAAIAAVGGSGGGGAQESTSQEILASLKEIISAHIFNSSMDGYVFVNLTNPTAGSILFQASNLIEINDNEMTSLSMSQNYLNAIAPNLKKVTFNKVTELLAQTFRAANQIEELYLPELLRPVSDSLFNMQSCRVLHIPKVLAGYIPNLSYHYKLIDLMIGVSIVNNFNISSWNTSEPLLANSQSLLTPEDIEDGFTSNLEKLLYNIREHIAGILVDRTGLSSLTITFSAAYKAAIQADTATSDAFTNKNWTIA